MMCFRCGRAFTGTEIRQGIPRFVDGEFLCPGCVTQILAEYVRKRREIGELS